MLKGGHLAGAVSLQLGDLFDGPADLIVLPCSTSGTVSRFVADRLAAYSIPRPRAGMALGEVDIQPFTGGENIAQFVAFAASVRENRTTSGAIRSIGELLGAFAAQTPAAKAVSVPLLGAGAGHLGSEAAVEELAAGFTSTAPHGSRLNIFVLHRDVFTRLTGRKPAPHANLEPKSQPRRVFISYSGTSDVHKDWVVSLATHLRENGVDARIDQWHLRGGMNLPQWMINEITLAERVLIISDARYAERADGGFGGAGWETRLIQGEILAGQADPRKYMVVVRDDDYARAVPIYLRTMFAIHWPSTADEESLRQKLLKEIYEVELAPPIGARPSFIVLA